VWRAGQIAGPWWRIGRRGCAAAHDFSVSGGFDLAISASPKRVSQPDLADQLHLTPRRIRQLVQARVLPDADGDGLFDLERCQRFYRLYADGSDAAWSSFFLELTDLAERAEYLVRKAVAERGTRVDLAKAGPVIAELAEALQFVVAVQSANDAERTFVSSMFDRMLGDAFGALLRRAFKFAGADLELTEDQIEQQIAAFGRAA